MENNEDSYSEDTRKLMNGIFNLLKNNSHRFYNSKEIQQEFNVSGPKVREAVHNIREHSYPIISSNKGYKWAETAKELNDSVANLWGRAKSILRAMQGLAESRKDYFPGAEGLAQSELLQAEQKIQQAIKSNE